MTVQMSVVPVDFAFRGSKTKQETIHFGFDVSRNELEGLSYKRLLSVRILKTKQTLSSQLERLGCVNPVLKGLLLNRVLSFGGRHLIGQP